MAPAAKNTRRSAFVLASMGLVLSLVGLEQHGVRVECSPTEFGQTLPPIVEALHVWGIEQSRAVGELDQLKIRHRHWAKPALRAGF